MHKCFDLAAGAHRDQQIDEVTREVLQAIEPINIAGLGDAQRRNWYPVDAKDLFNASTKLGATEDDISQLLKRCGFWKQGVAAE
jgi:hypothetical protein